LDGKEGMGKSKLDGNGLDKSKSNTGELLGAEDGDNVSIPD